MKWFKHLSDARTNLKLIQVVMKHGIEGYGLWWMCVELVAQQGEKNRIKKEKCWKMTLARDSMMSEERLMTLLQAFGEYRLLDKIGLEMGDLYIPSLKEYGDEYSEKVRRESRHQRDKVVLDKIRIDKNRLDKNILYFDRFWTAYPRKIAKKDSLKSWCRIQNLDDSLMEKIMSGLERQKLSNQWRDAQYIPHPATWINQERWTDEIATHIIHPMKINLPN